MAQYTLTDEQEEDFVFANKMNFGEYLKQSFVQWSESAKHRRKASIVEKIKDMDDEMVKKLVHTAGIKM
jgi:hypothetical protein